jgi:predicted nucleic acid-binding protein
MISIVVVDSGPLLAAANRADPDHASCMAILRDPEYRLVIPALCVAEVSYFLGTRLGAEVESRFLRGLETFDVRAPGAAEWPRIAELVAKYADVALGGTDASVISLAESLDTDLVLTLDRRHFSMVTPKHRKHWRILPSP